VARPTPGAVVSGRTRLPSLEDDAVVAGWAADPTSPFEDWSGPAPSGSVPGPPAASPEGGGRLTVTDGSGTPVGTVSWRPVVWGPVASTAFELGISLRPQHRGHGHGTRAHRLLVAHLLATTSVHRVQATTDVENAAEQRALERAGFRREGVLREAQWRRGAYHDLVMYSRLRSDADGADPDD
jgi:RimJ/RimL family protein N-acetyltransferase